MAHSHPVLPGGLSEADHERIFEMAEKGWKPSRIAQTLSKHPSTVQWFMYRQGLSAPSYGKPAQVRKDGTVVKPFLPEEDDVILKLRIDGAGPTSIARTMTERFGHKRSMHTIACRLVMLASREEMHA